MNFVKNGNRYLRKQNKTMDAKQHEEIMDKLEQIRQVLIELINKV